MESIEEKAKLAAGNWRTFESFAWHETPENPERWYIGYTHNRDSGLVDQSNAAVIDKEMEPFTEDGTAISESHNHWACGWIDGYAILVYDEKGDITPAFQKWYEIHESLEDYPLLDESAYCDLEYEATIENIEGEGGRLTKDKAPDDWARQVYSWLWDNDEGSLENCDDQGAYPSEEAIGQALKALGLLDPEVEIHATEPVEEK